MPTNRDEYIYRYVVEADGTLPGASFRDQTEDFLNRLHGEITSASGDYDELWALAQLAKDTADEAKVTATQAAGVAADALAAANNAVHKTGNETVAGTKTFTSPIVGDITGAAGSVPWSGVTGAPSTFPPSAHTHGNITNDGKLPTASRVVVTNGSKEITTSSVTATELSYLSGATSNIQQQINALPADGDLVHKTGNESIAGQKVFAEGPYGTAAAVSSTSIDLSGGVVFTKTIAANTAFTITGVPSGKAATFNLILTNGGAYTVTWPASVEWTDDTPPELTSGGKDVLTFLTPDGGTTWYGTVALSGVGVSA